MALNQPEYKKSAFLVLDGEFHEYAPRLDSSFGGKPLRVYHSGESFGINSLAMR